MAEIPKTKDEDNTVKHDGGYTSFSEKGKNLRKW